MDLKSDWKAKSNMRENADCTVLYRWLNLEDEVVKDSPSSFIWRDYKYGEVERGHEEGWW